MSEVKRYDICGFGGGMARSEDGAWYHMDDYDALEDDCNRLYAMNNRLINDGIKLADQRDAALAELAALKGGQEAVGGDLSACPIAYAVKGSDVMFGTAYEAYQYMGEGSEPFALYTAPPAQASAWVPEGWKLVPVEPTPEMLAAGDKYIGTPATYKSMLSACPSPAITKDFSQFLSAVMDAAGLIRHGRQSKELSEYLGMKCMEYRGVAPSAGSQGGDV